MTEVLPVIPAAGAVSATTRLSPPEAKAPALDSSSDATVNANGAPKDEVRAPYGQALDGDSTVVMPIVRPSGSAGRPSGATPAVTPSSEDQSLSVTETGPAGPPSTRLTKDASTDSATKSGRDIDADNANVDDSEAERADSSADSSADARSDSDTAFGRDAGGASDRARTVAAAGAAAAVAGAVAGTGGSADPEPGASEPKRSSAGANDAVRRPAADDAADVVDGTDSDAAAEEDCRPRTCRPRTCRRGRADRGWCGPPGRAEPAWRNGCAGRLRCLGRCRCRCLGSGHGWVGASRCGGRGGCRCGRGRGSRGPPRPGRHWPGGPGRGFRPCRRPGVQRYVGCPFERRRDRRRRPRCGWRRGSDRSRGCGPRRPRPDRTLRSRIGVR